MNEEMNNTEREKWNIEVPYSVEKRNVNINSSKCYYGIITAIIAIILAISTFVIKVDSVISLLYSISALLAIIVISYLHYKTVSLKISHKIEENKASCALERKLIEDANIRMIKLQEKILTDKINSENKELEKNENQK